MEKGFLSINDYSPDKPHWAFMCHFKNRNSTPLSIEQMKSKYIECSVFFLSYFGLYQGVFLENKATWQQGVENYKFLEKTEDTATVILKVENIIALGYRILYNDGDDTYFHVIFDTEAEALECFNYIINLDFNFHELEDILMILGFVFG